MLGHADVGAAGFQQGVAHALVEQVPAVGNKGIDEGSYYS